MPGVYIGTSPLKAAYVGTTPVKEIYVGTTKVRPAETVQTFDFKNNGKLNWTGTSTGYGTPDFVTGQGWRIYRSNTDSDGNVTPPSSIFNTQTLKRVRIRMYKGIATTGTSSRAYGVGVGVIGTINGSRYNWRWSSAGANINYDRIGAQGINIKTVNITGEVLMDFDLSDTRPVLSLNNNKYTLTASTSANYQTIWSNKTFALEVCNWRGGSGDVYIRKVEITTK